MGGCSHGFGFGGMCNPGACAGQPLMIPLPSTLTLPAPVPVMSTAGCDGGCMGLAAAATPPPPPPITQGASPAQEGACGTMPMPALVDGVAMGSAPLAFSLLPVAPVNDVGVVGGVP